MIKRVIPSTGEELPVIGLGTWKTFDTRDESALKPLKDVLAVMQGAGCTLIDSSPMYGESEAVIGRLTDIPKWRYYFFYATKVWTNGREAGQQQMELSFQKMKRKTMDLVQVHNLTDWKTHLQTLRSWKDAGRIRYIGITHYVDSMHDELERILKKETVDFVQFNYSIFSRHAEKSLLQTAAGRGVATLINRPYGEGRAFATIANHSLPGWAIEHGIDSWSRFFLLYIISNPAVTVAIPATSDPLHARENFTWENPALPDQRFREKMAAFIDTIANKR